MKVDWREMPIGDFLIPVREAVTIGDDGLYKQITVSMHGRGVRLRQSVLGKAIKTKNQFLAKAGRFIYSRIDARHGAMGLVPNELDGAVITGDFPTFDFNLSQVEPRYFEYMTKRSWFEEMCAAPSKGVTNRKRLKEAELMGFRVPLPPLPEQRRIVATLDKAASRVEEAKRLAGQIEEEQELLLDSLYRESLKQGATKILMRNCVRQARRAVVIKDEIEYKQVTVSMHFRGVFKRQVILGMGIKTKQQYLAKSGDFIFSRIDARNGAFGFVPKELDGAVVTGDFPCFEIDESIIKKEVLAVVLKTTQFVQPVLDASRGVTNRRRFKEAQLLGIEIVIPNMVEQKQIASICAKLWKSRTIHQQTAASLDALMPALLDQAFRGEL